MKRKKKSTENSIRKDMQQKDEKGGYAQK